jgi:hypothetical protein
MLSMEIVADYAQNNAKMKTQYWKTAGIIDITEGHI